MKLIDKLIPHKYEVALVVVIATFICGMGVINSLFMSKPMKAQSFTAADIWIGIALAIILITAPIWAAARKR